MKIGILTYHYVCNYGAVLQAWSLLQILKNMGHDAEIIQFEPAHIPVWSPKRWLARTIPMAINKYRREWENFRKKSSFSSFKNMLKLGNFNYKTIHELKANPPQYDVYICGSDQVWWCTPLKNGIYFLDFGSEDVRRIAYSPSFGTDSIPEQYKQQIGSYLKRFYAISVRETSGLNMLRQMGISSTLVPDPTLFHDPTVYQKIMRGTPVKENIFIYFLHQDAIENREVIEAYIRKLGKRIYSVDLHQNRLFAFPPQLPSVEEWLLQLSQSDFVLTNSFHAVVFSLMFHRKFIVLLRAGAGAQMNDRILTLLNKVGLERLAVSNINQNNLDSSRLDNVDWSKVDDAIHDWRQIGVDFLSQALD
jgi:polysaccharide pyruvyl transferase WcaK-like protein